MALFIKYNSRIRNGMTSKVQREVLSNVKDLIAHHKYARAWDAMTGGKYEDIADYWGYLYKKVAPLIRLCAEKMSNDEYIKRYNVSAFRPDRKDKILEKAEILIYFDESELRAWDLLTFGSMENFEKLWKNHRYDEAVALLKQAENAMDDEEKALRGIDGTAPQPKNETKTEPQSKAGIQTKPSDTAPQSEEQPQDDEKILTAAIAESYKSEKQLYAYLVKAMKENDMEAMYQASLCLVKMPGEKEQQLATDLMITAALEGHPQANADGAFAFYDEGMYKEAMDFAVRGAQKGDFDCMVIGMYMYDDGKVDPDRYQYSVFLDAAAVHPKAKEKSKVSIVTGFGDKYLEGKMVPKDIKKAMACYKIAAENGSVYAMHCMAVSYYSEEEIKDLAESFRWTLKSAENGFVPGMMRCGAAYVKGEGVEQNYEKAFYWYNKAYENGDDTSGLMLAMLYNDGLGTAKDTAKAALLLHKLAKSNDNLVRETALKYIKQYNL